MMFFRFIVIYVLLFSLVRAEWERDYGIDFWQTDRGLPQMAANALGQTDDGFLWMATWNGLARIDGHAVKTYHSSSHPDLPSDRIRQMWAHGDTVWLSAGSKGMVALRDDTFTEYSWPEGTAASASDVAFDGDGGVWVACGKVGLAHMAAGDRIWQIIPLPEGAVEMVAYDPAGTIEVFTPEGDRWSLTFSDERRFERLAPVPMMDMISRSEGGVWELRGYSSHPYSIHRRTQTGISDWVFLPNAVVATCIAEGIEGELWIGTKQHGIWRVGSDQTLRSWSTEEGLPSGAVISILVDTEGSVWGGLDNAGLVHLTPAPFAEFTDPDWGRVQSLAIEADGSVLMASLQAGLVKLAPDGSAEIGGDGPQGESMISVATTRDGATWLGGYDGTIWEGRDGSWTPHRLFEEQRDRRIYYLMEDSRGRLWATSYRGLARWENGEWKVWDEGFSWLRSISEAPDGSVWLASRGRGLVRIDPADNIEVMVPEADLPRDAGFTMQFDRRGNLWMGSFGGGVTLLHQGELYHLGEENGLPDDMAMSFAEDDAGTLWIGASRGIFRAEIDDLVAVAKGERARVDGLNFARADGLDQLEFPGGFGPLVARAPDGAIWMASLSGVVRLDPVVTSAPVHDEAETASPVAIMAARVDGTAVDVTGLAMAPEAHRLEVEFGVVGLRSPEKVRTRYRLTGYDETWIDAAGQGQATYTELPPGDYAFEVVGRDGLGRWSEAPVTMAVTVIPAWWQRPIWQAIMVLMGVGLSWWIGQAYANRRLRLRLERVQHEQALTRERERIARDIHDILGANLARLRHLGNKVVNTDVATQEDLAKVGALCAESMDNLRELVWACDPKCDTLVSTVDFLEQQIGEVARELELQPVFEITPDLPDFELAANQRHALLLMFREAMTNTIKHAGAKTLTFRVTVEGLAVHLSLADDGLGFEAGLIPSGGHGLGNMPERAKAAGLEYVLESEPGQGTKISVVLPLA